jgi:hypothetical protein
MYLKLFLQVEETISRFVVQGEFSSPIGPKVLTSRLSRFIMVLAPKGRS